MSNISPSVQLVTEVLQYMIEVVKTYQWEGKLIYKTLIGFDGMGPDISIELIDISRKEPSCGAELQFWCHPHDATKYVLIYSSFDSQTRDIDHHSIDISYVEAATPFLKKAMTLFSVDTTTSDNSS